MMSHVRDGSNHWTFELKGSRLVSVLHTYRSGICKAVREKPPLGIKRQGINGLLAQIWRKRYADQEGVQGRMAKT